MATAEPSYSGFGRAGFSLLEVMIALAIAGIALVSLLSLANRSLDVHDRLQKTTQATLLAQHMMAQTEVDAQAGLQDFSREQGTFEEPFEQYRWRLEYEETPLPSVRMVTVTVSWGTEEENETVALDSFIF